MIRFKFMLLVAFLGSLILPIFSLGAVKSDLLYLVVDRSGSIPQRHLEEPIKKAVEDYVNTKPATTEVRLRFFSTEAPPAKVWPSMTTQAKGDFSKYFAREFKPEVYTRLFDTVAEVLTEVARDAANYATIDIKILSDGQDEGAGPKGSRQSVKYKSWNDLVALGWNLKQSNEKAFVWWVTLDVPVPPEGAPPHDGPFLMENKENAAGGFSLHAKPVAAFEIFPKAVTPDQVVKMVQMYSPGTIDRTEWVLGDGTTKTNLTDFVHRYMRPGSYAVVLRVFGPGGSAAATNNVDVVEKVPLKAVFSMVPRPPRDARVGEDVQLIDHSEGRPESFSWNLGLYGTLNDQSPSFTPSKEGEVNIVLQVTRGKETSSATGTIKVLPLPPDPSFTVSPSAEIGLGLEAKFVAQDRMPGLLHSWTIHGEDLKGETVTWLATTTGLFQVTHCVTGPGGTVSAEQSLSVRPPDAPSVDFTWEPKGFLRIGDKVKLSALKTQSSWEHKWDIAGKPYSGESIIWEAVSAGSFTVTHSVKVPNVPQQNLSKDLSVLPPDSFSADFEIDPARPVNVDEVVNLSAVESGAGLTHDWRIGVEKLSETGPVVRWKPAKQGVFLVKHSVRSKDVESSQIKKSIFVADVFEAHLSASSAFGFGTIVVKFKDQSHGAVARWAWDFGDGETADVQNPTHRYWNNGLFMKETRPRLTVRSADGREAKDPGEVLIKVAPMWWAWAAGIVTFLLIWVFIVVPLSWRWRLASLQEVLIGVGNEPNRECFEFAAACKRHRWSSLRKIFGLTPFASFAAKGDDVELDGAVERGRLQAIRGSVWVYAETPLCMKEKALPQEKTLSAGASDILRTDGKMFIPLTDASGKEMGSVNVQGAAQGDSLPGI